MDSIVKTTSIQLDISKKLLSENIISLLENNLFFSEIALEFCSKKNLNGGVKRFFRPIKDLYWIDYKVDKTKLYLTTKDYFSFMLLEKLQHFEFDTYTIFLINKW